MADDTTLNLGTGGDVIGTDEIAGVKYQRVKLIHGADGVNDGDVASGNPLPVSGAVTVSGVATAANQATEIASLATIAGAVSGTEVQVDVLTIAAGDNNIGNVDVATLPAVTIAAAQTLATVTTVGAVTSITNAVTVNSHAVTNAGTFAVQNVSGGLTQGMVDETGSSAVDAAAIGGGTPHDSVDSGFPVKIGAKVETSPKGITLVADGDRTNLYADADGIQIVKLNTTGADLISERVSNTDGTSTAFSNFSQVANTYNYVNAVSAFNSSAGACYVDIRDGTAGAVLYTLYLPAGGGAVVANATPLFKSSANTALAYDVSAATTTVYINMTGFQSKV